MKTLLLCLTLSWVDFKSLTARLQRSAEGQRNPLLSIISLLDQLTFTARSLNAKGEIESRLEIKMAEPNENSLHALFKLFR